MITQRRAQILTIAALAAAAVLPAQASAHQTIVSHGIGPGADVATVNDTLESGGLRAHAVIQVTDKECDGHPVFARYRWSNGLLKVVEDHDGCRPGVGQAFAPEGVSIIRYQICEQAHPRPCSPIKTT